MDTPPSGNGLKSPPLPAQEPANRYLPHLGTRLRFRHPAGHRSDRERAKTPLTKRLLTTGPQRLQRACAILQFEQARLASRRRFARRISAHEILLCARAMRTPALYRPRAVHRALRWVEIIFILISFAASFVRRQPRAITKGCVSLLPPYGCLHLAGQTRSRDKAEEYCTKCCTVVYCIVVYTKLPAN